jgi:hypothetical protein
MRVTAGHAVFDAVDLYNSASGTWSTAQLSVARQHLCATSVGNVALFAGGWTGICSVASFYGGIVLELLCVDDAWLRRIFVAALLCMWCRRLSSDEGHCRCCGLVQQCVGHMVDCAAQCGARFACGDICWERGPFRGGPRGPFR